MIIGVDEVGRGCLFGDVVAAAVILPNGFKLPQLTDSKKLSPKKRQELFEIITKECLWSVAKINPQIVDEINILQATMLAMKTAVEKLSVDYSSVLVDGNKCPDLPNCKAIIKGDLTHPVISAASIVAKVSRDSDLIEIAKKYPEYGFENHKGYGTKKHLLAIEEYGVLEEHRKTFAPIKNAIKML
jgi:ribonuclease HII